MYERNDSSSWRQNELGKVFYSDTATYGHGCVAANWVGSFFGSEFVSVSDTDILKDTLVLEGQIFGRY